jgi:hypothetical protein
MRPSSLRLATDAASLFFVLASPSVARADDGHVWFCA